MACQESWAEKVIIYCTTPQFWEKRLSHVGGARQGLWTREVCITPILFLKMVSLSPLPLNKVCPTVVLAASLHFSGTPEEQHHFCKGIWVILQTLLLRLITGRGQQEGFHSLHNYISLSTIWWSSPSVKMLMKRQDRAMANTGLNVS